MNIRKHQELLDFWEYSHGFDSEDGTVPIDEDVTFEATRQELQIELKHFNEMDLEQELHPLKDDDIQPEDEHPNKTILKRELRAIALKRLEDGARTISDFEEVIKEWDLLDSNRERKERYHEIGRENIDSKKDVAPLAIVIPAPINHAYWRQLMKGDYIDIISNCPYEMHNSLSDEDYSKIIYELKDDHKELIYFLYLRDFPSTTNDNFTHGNFTMEELDFLLRHETEIPATMEKLDKEKLALLKEIGVVVRRIAREQERLAKEKAEKRKKNNRTNRKKEV